MTDPNQGFVVELPAGGTMHLLSEEEVALFESAVNRYKEDYALTKLNDLSQVGAIVTQQIILFRAQQQLAGLEPEVKNGVPTGRYIAITDKKKDSMASLQKRIKEATEEIRNIEKSLGIDKKTREAGGQHTVANYLTIAKKAAHQFGVRIAERVKEYERVMKESEWKLRMLENADAEDLQYHDLTPEKFCEWLRKELANIAENDKKWAKTKGKVFVGKL